MARAFALLALSVPLLLLQVASAQAFFQYSPYPIATMFAMLPVYAVVLWLVSAGGWPARLVAMPVIPAAFLLALWAAIYRLYPYVKSLPAPPTSDTALMAPIEALSMGRGLYDLDGLIDVPASPGPAWVLANAPFTFAGESWIYTLMTPAYVLLGWLTVRLSGRSMLFANSWVLLLFSGLICWMMAVGGSDILAMSVMVLVLYLLVERYALERISLASIFLAVIVGLFAPP
jgi:hypothetical protein